LINLLIIIAIVLIILDILFWETVGVKIISGIMLVAFIIVECIILDNLSGSFVANEKIAMYEQENNNIQIEVATIVESYKLFEADTFQDLKTTSPTTLVNLYPQLQSNQLVEKQIDTYINNNFKIKELKENKINASVCKWWLYFGR
jgi:hypothetical protein